MLTLEPGTYSFDIEVENENKWGPWIETVNGEYEAEAGQCVQYLGDGYRGWHDATLMVGENGLLRTRANDPSYQLDKMWKNADGTYNPGRYRVGVKPVGEWNNDVWPKPALEIHTSNSDLYVTVQGSPAESLVLVGDNNTLRVYAQPGAQSRLMQDRPTVKIKGNNNTVSGYIQTQMTGLFLQGNYNHAKDLTIVVGPDAVGDDVGALYVYCKNGEHGNRGTRVQVIGMGHAFPATHGRQAIYFDDTHDGGSLVDCVVRGFPRGVFGHGATNTRVDNLLAIDVDEPVVFDPHHTTPDIVPEGNSSTVDNRSEITA